ncbi:MAG TPA: hypothetical protein GX509_10150 [Firmicutes bacterium]|nr:hypothetical protein [Bacillota bacterium]
MEWVMGVDGGGSKTRFVACSLDGRLLCRSMAQGINLRTWSPEDAIKHLNGGSRDLISAAHLIPSSCHYVYLRIAGIIGSGCTDIYEEALRAQGYNCHIQIEGDIRCAWAGATAFGNGIVVGSGTGSFAYGEDEHGMSHLAGGWGHLFGDEGSAYDLGRMALVACFKASDGRGQWTQLAKMVRDELNTDDLRKAASTLRARRDLVTTVARLTVLVFKAEEMGDPLAKSIIQRAASELAEATYAVWKSVFPDLDAIRVFPIGSVFSNQPRFVSEFSRALGCLLPGAQVSLPRFTPDIGAGLIALRNTVSASEWQRVLCNLEVSIKTKGNER